MCAIVHNAELSERPAALPPCLYSSLGSQLFSLSSLASRISRFLRPLQLNQMPSTRLPLDSFFASSGDPAEHRRRVQQAADERAAQRDSELQALASPVKAPRERIGMWERLHFLSLPRTSGHALVRVIARQTQLTVGQVHEEQLRRAGTLSSDSGEFESRTPTSESKT